MPSQILHVLFGEDVLRAAVAVAAADGGAGPAAADLGAFVERTLGEQGGFFRLGCQGPDLFYHNQRTRPVSLEYGTLLHRRGYGAFTADLLRRTMGDTPRSAGPGPRTAYALGFATHALLDRAAHPYIVYKAGWVSPAKPETARYARCHAFFERILDVLMLERLRGTGAAAWDQEALLSRWADPPPETLIDAIADSLRAVFPERAGIDDKLRRRIVNAFRDAAAFYRITNPARTSLNMRLPDGYEYLASDKGRASVALVYPERFSLGLDYLNLSRSPWKHPCRDDSDSRSFPEIYADAVARAAAVAAPALGTYWTSGSLDEAVERAVGDAGLSPVTPGGLPCPPIHADPFPLDQVLDQQYLLRKAWIAGRASVSL